ncbi:uncharacterized protein DUF4253 [Kribbella orskensis]|uniref:Uncharacterized protein DUF4253 n=1 Tax=Kribbella orskensis TaxID=2512216 RepID=A0ABY2BXV4_9ACTN|nr:MULTISPECIES: DUF4253 domain-containing protein [Kribbella]TCN44053.1 uncharacterized protein DUF4253 [Kribbella sp. VKM Ac-2500]TCO32169.1 uncharacterized protein DUF4253 [Kribbella orskensis]
MPADLTASLSDDLPPGRLVGDAGGPPLFWLSEGPPDAELYQRLLAAHLRTGLWPVITDAQAWTDGLFVEPVADIDDMDPLTVMRDIWTGLVTPVEGEAEFFGDDPFDDFKPFGQEFPGLAAAGEPMAEPGEVAVWFAGELGLGPDSRLLLAPAARSADLPAVVGWSGPMNHSNELAPLLAILRSWEGRFGVRLVRVGFDTMDLSVAAPPVTPEHAVQVAAEHVVFCPDNVEQGPGNLLEYAETIQGRNTWSFWWD